MNQWNDFNNADDNSSFDLIPKGTLAKVIMHIKPGNYNDPNNGWTDGIATLSDKTGAVYLDCEFTVLEGQYAKRKIWSLIGLHSPKGDTWANIGRTFIKGILNSARGIQPKDTGERAMAARRIRSLTELDGIEFLARIDVGKDGNGDDRNEIKTAITPDHKEYANFMGQPGGYAPPSTPPQQQTSGNFGKPSWLNR